VGIIRREDCDQQPDGMYQVKFMKNIEVRRYNIIEGQYILLNKRIRG
jgi:hypothetical protein